MIEDLGLRIEGLCLSILNLPSYILDLYGGAKGARTLGL